MKSKLTKIISSITLLLCVCLSASCSAMMDSDGVVVAGSTSVQPYVEILAEDYAHLYPDRIIDVQGGGSSAGIQAVQSGTAQIGMSSRKLSESEEHLWSLEIAIDGLAIIVNPGNPVTSLTLEQLRMIYAGVYTNWSDVGGINAEIHITTREEGSGTRSAFEELVMNKERITPKAIVQDSNGAVRQLVSDDIYSIGYISLGLVDVGQRPVSAVEIDGIKPTAENIRNGEYSLYRSFLFVAEYKPSGTAMQFIEYILSDSGSSVLMNEGLIPGAASDIITE